MMLKENDVDSILRAAGSGVVTAQGWGNKDTILRRTMMVNLLAGLSGETINNLSLSIPRKTTTSAISREAEGGMGDMSSPAGAAAGSIFVVHGHAPAELYQAVRMLERITGFEVTILHEQPNSGRTILEKFEHHATAASFAVVLLTPDDEGRARSAKETRARGRQNVIFELGFFFAKLGRERVAVLLGDGVEKPSDIDGLVYIELDRSGAWKQVLARELNTANIPVDFSKIP